MAGTLDPKLEAKLEALVQRVEGLSLTLVDPEITADMDRYRTLSRAYAELEPVAGKFHEYGKVRAELAEVLELVGSADDAEMRAMAADEVKSLEQQLEALEHELKIMLLTDDPNDARNVVLEIRAGTGGDEATLFAGELFRLYCRFAEAQGWTKTVTLSDGTVEQLGATDWSVIQAIGLHHWGEENPASSVVALVLFLALCLYLLRGARSAVRD